MKRFVLMVSAAALVQAAGSASFAQSETKVADAGAKAEKLETVTVTASKRVERLKDVAGSVSALSADDLKSTGQVRLQDYAYQVPGLVVDDTAGGGGFSQVYIRGVTTGSGGNPTVGFYIDDTPFGSSTSLGLGECFPPDLDPSDLSQIEVLRGPQGTLYGAGSIGGLIKYVTARPDYDHYSGHLEVDGSAVEGGGTGYGVRGSINVPLSDQVAIRASGFDRQDPGYIDNTLTGRTNVNSGQSYGGRFSLAAKLSQDWTIQASALVQNSSIDGTSVIDVDSVTYQPVYGALKQAHAFGSGNIAGSYGLYDLRVEGNLGWASFLSVSSYGRFTANGVTDLTSQYGPTIGGMTGLSDVGLVIHDTLALNKVTQEFRLSSPSDQRLSWQVGAFYTNESNKVGETMPTYDAITGHPLPAAVPLLEDWHDPNRYEEVAIYGDVTYKFTERFDVTGGLRYGYNSQRAVQTYDGLFVGGPGGATLRSHDNAITYLFTPRYRIDDHTLAYIRIASGYRPGGPNIVVSGVSPGYDPDTVVNYEGGVKGDLFDGRVSYDIAGFYIDWSHIQLRQVSSYGTQYFGNAGAASSAGFEGSLVWSPIEGLDLSGNVSYTDASLGKDVPPPLVGVTGDRLPYTPRWSGQFSADYRFPLWNGWKGQTGLAYRYVGSRFADFPSDPTYPRYPLPSYDQVDFHAGIEADAWQATFYVKNVGDSRGQTAAYAFANLQQVTIAQPRTYGITISRQF